jgi:hypothetical protein
MREGLMAEPKRLRMGIDSPSPSMHEEESRVAILQATIEHYLPQFATAVRKSAAEDIGGKAGHVILHQDAFASGYDDDEYTLLGMAVKYAGLKGVTLNIIGKNHETF